MKPTKRQIQIVEHFVKKTILKEDANANISELFNLLQKAVVAAKTFNENSDDAYWDTRGDRDSKMVARYLKQIYSAFGTANPNDAGFIQDNPIR